MRAFLVSLLLVSSWAVAVPVGPSSPAAKKSVATYPWVLDKGTPTARQTAMKSLAEIAKKMGYAVLDQARAEAEYKSMGIPMLKPVGGPTLAQLAQFGKKVGANYVVFGSIGWHTRSVWVGAGPKTISTATVDASVLDVGTGKVVYAKQDVTARSDEKENAAKVAGALLLTPLVTAVSGGPQTPREQRAVQIALARAFEDWNREIGK
jgi:hypothetical protein